MGAIVGAQARKCKRCRRGIPKLSFWCYQWPMPFTPEFLAFAAQVRGCLTGSVPGSRAARLVRGACLAALFIAHGAVLTAVAGMAALPVVAERYLNMEASRVIGRSVTLETLRFNPFTFEIRVTGLKVADPGGGELAGFSSLEINLDPSALAAKRFALSRFVLKDPELHISRDASGQTNLAGIFPGGGEEEPSSSTSLNLALLPPGFRFSVGGVNVTGGVFTFDDAVTGNRHEARDLSFSIASLSSDRPGIHEFFTSGGKLNESSLSLTVRGALAGPVTEFEARLDLNDVVLKHYTPYLLPLKRPLDMRVEHAGTRLRAVLPEGGQGLPRIEGAAKVSNMSLEDQGVRVAGFDTLEAQGVSADLESGEARIERVALDAPFLKVARSEEGVVSLLRLVEAERPGSPAPKAPGQAPRLRVAEVSVSRGRVEAVDKSLGIETALERLEASLAGLDVAAGRFESLSLEARGDGFERVTLTARGGYDPPDLSAEASLEGVDLSRPLPALERAWPGLKLSGSADCSLGLELARQDAGNAAKIKAGLEVRDARVQPQGLSKPLLAASRLAVRSAVVDAVSRKVTAGLVSVEGGGAFLERAPDGSLRGLPPAQPGQGGGSPAWDVSLAKAQVTGFFAEYRDARSGAGLRVDLDELSLANAGTDLSRSVGISARGRAMGGAFDVQGDVRPAGPQAALKLTLDKLPLAELARFAPPLPVRILSGDAGLAGQLDASLGKDGLKGSFTGNVSAALLKVARPGEDRPFCSATGMEAKELRVNFAPLELSARSLLVDEPWTQVELDDKGMPVPPLKAADKGPDKPGGPAPAYRFERLDVRRGWLEVVGNGFEPHMSVLLSGIEASLAGAASGKAAAFTLEMAAGHTGRLSGKGEAGVAEGGALLDFTATLKNMDLGELSPLSRRITGFPIERGMLGVVLGYKATPKALDLKNKIVVTGIRLGPKSPGALMKDVPLDLAVSLLSDAKGVIDLDIPITGDPASARADLKDVISTAMAGALARVFFSPLAFLNVRPGEGQTVGVAFPPGTADLSAEDRKTLAALAEAVSARPKLNLEVAAYVDQAGEAEALSKVLSAPPQSLSGKTAMLPRPGVTAPGEPVQPGPADWARLARLRQDAVLEFLASTGKLPQERVYPLAIDTGPAPAAKGLPGHRAEVRLRF